LAAFLAFKKRKQEWEGVGNKSAQPQCEKRQRIFFDREKKWQQIRNQKKKKKK